MNLAVNWWLHKEKAPMGCLFFVSILTNDGLGSVFHVYVCTWGFASINLTRACNGLFFFAHFLPLANPTWKTAHGEQYGKEVGGEAHGAIYDS